MKKIILITFILSACATANVTDIEGGKIIAIPFGLSEERASSENSYRARHAWFSSSYVTETFEYESLRACPKGYVVTKKRFDEDSNSMIWELKCD